jgi:2-keto-4-pentenoate hydratase/2-oxohepta-3-ene-1,7-dioic acid hydratase in catechol pathway
MKIVRYSSAGSGTALGILADEDTIAPLPGLSAGSAPARLADVLSSPNGTLDDLRSRAQDSRHTVDRRSVRLLSPISPGTLIVCAGANFWAHLKEMGDELPDKPAWFIKNANAIVGPDDPIILPGSASGHVDWEGELAVVIGRPCHAVAAADAWDYVAGYTLLNDVSARDAIPTIQAAQTPLDGRWAWTDMLLGKQFPTFAPIGPAVVTRDEIKDVGSVQLTTTVNGRVMQDSLISDMAVGIPDLIEQFSRYFRFEPGDVISTGTPAGAGAGQKPPIFLKSGDEVVVSATGVGELRNPVRAAARE